MQALRKIRKKDCICVAIALMAVAYWQLPFASVAIAAGKAAIKVFKEDFSNDKVGMEPANFASIVGDWYVTEDKGNKVYSVDGRKWSKGKVATAVADKARAIYGNRYAEFLDRVQAYAYYPLSVYKPVENFKNGEISLRFKGVTGRIDQCAGIAFNLKPNGDYLIYRGNCLENNIVLWKYEQGKRSPLKWVYKITMPPGFYHSLSMKVSGKKIEGYFNGTKVLDYEYSEPIDGKVGIWSKSDSVMFFDDYSVKGE